jgi:hypothetical protein
MYTFLHFRKPQPPARRWTANNEYPLCSTRSCRIDGARHFHKSATPYFSRKQPQHPAAPAYSASRSPPASTAIPRPAGTT